MLIDCDDHLVSPKPQFFARGVNNSHVGLVGNQPIDILRTDANLFAVFHCNIGQRSNREFKDSLPVHTQEGIADDLAMADGTRYR